MIHGARRPRFLLLPLLAAVAPGCASYPWQKNTLYVNSGTALYREKKVADGNQVSLGHKHPIDLPLEKTVLVLSQLVYYHDPLVGKPQTLHIFTDQEIRALAEPMTIALQAITPDERLRFLVIRSSWTDVMAGTRGTSGVVFRTTDGVLHLAFDKIHEQYQVAEGGEPDDVPIASEPTTLTKASPIVPTTGMRHHLEPEGKKYPRWIEIANLDEVKPPAPPPAELAKPAGEPPREITIPTRPQVTSPDRPAPPPASPAATAAATAPAAVGQPAPAGAGDEEKYQRLRAKLEQLKRLRQDAVLSDEEYQKEYQKLIAEL